MKNVNKVLFCFLLVLLLTGNLAFAQGDAKGCKDHPLFTRMQNFYIRDCKVKEFDYFDFEEMKDGKWSKIRVEGRKYEIAYYLKSGATKPGEVEIVRNYTNAIQTVGGTVLGEKRGVAHMKLLKDGNETWIKVFAGGAGAVYQLTIVEKKAMAQQVVADAKTMATDIGSTGKIAIYGIYFDFDKAEVKPESEPALKEIAKLLSENPQLKLYVVGHTDNVGGLDYNMKLSHARAEAVLKALVSQYKMDANRLKSYGVGPLAPITSNKTEEGKAKNRRVELVEQ
jgi:OmpA-OmpF porin, OOP family